MDAADAVAAPARAGREHHAGSPELVHVRGLELALEVDVHVGHLLDLGGPPVPDPRPLGKAGEPCFAGDPPSEAP